MILHQRIICRTTLKTTFLFKVKKISKLFNNSDTLFQKIKVNFKDINFNVMKKWKLKFK